MTSISNVLSIKDSKRKLFNQMMIVFILLASIIALYPLFSVFYYVLSRGVQGLNWTFFSSLPKPVGEAGGGMGNAILGSLKIVGLASLIGIPWGVATGIFLSEYSFTKTSKILRFSSDLLMGVPSIVIGIFVFAMVVKPMGGFSALAGAIALALIMIPIVSRNTEEMLKTIPVHYREAGLALGIHRWKVILFILVRGRMGAILTGVILSVARISGETAPLLFTAFNNQYWSSKFNEPTATLPVQIYTFAISPYEDWQNQAWAGALVLILFVFFINIVVRSAFAKAKDSSD